MRNFILPLILLILAVVESVTRIHLSLISVLILANFVSFPRSLWCLVIVGFSLDLLLGNLLGLNFLIIALLLMIFDLVKRFFWPNLTYEIFPKQVILVTVIQIVVALRLYNFLYNLANFGLFNFNPNLKLVPVEIVITLILFPAISYLSLKLIPPRQLELRF